MEKELKNEIHISDMKRTISAYASLTINEIVACIEAEPKISSVAVDPGATNAPHIKGMTNEDKIPNEGFIWYDILFYAFSPAENGTVKIILNVEAQKAVDPGYEIVTRGIFYCARMISAQKGIEFSHSEYDEIKKVYSIWICMDSGKKYGNTITDYSMRKKDLAGAFPDRPYSYDKLSVIVITLDEHSEADDEFLNMLNVLLSETLSPADKKERLDKEFGFAHNLIMEVNDMCNLSDLIEEKGIREGMEIGRQEGKLEIAKRLISLMMDDLFISNATGLSVKEVAEIRKKTI